MQPECSNLLEKGNTLANKIRRNVMPTPFSRPKQLTHPGVVVRCGTVNANDK